MMEAIYSSETSLDFLRDHMALYPRRLGSPFGLILGRTFRNICCTLDPALLESKQMRMNIVEQEGGTEVLDV
jgi:hypothetical protein